MHTAARGHPRRQTRATSGGPAKTAPSACGCARRAQLPGRRLFGAVRQCSAPHRAAERRVERLVGARRLRAELRRRLGESARQREAATEDILSHEGVGVLGHGRIGATRIVAAAVDGRPAKRDAGRARVCTQPSHGGEECEVLPGCDQAGVSDDVAVEVRVEHLGKLGGGGAQLAAVVAVRVGRVEEVVHKRGMCRDGDVGYHHQPTNRYDEQEQTDDIGAPTLPVRLEEFAFELVHAAAADHRSLLPREN